jgi:hypothetical protein
MHGPGHQFLGKARFDRAINSLTGILEGIAADSKINERETAFLAAWLDDHAEYADRHPFNELIPKVAAALEDGVLTADERADLTWLCERLQSTKFYGETTAGLQRLHGLVGGIAADGVIDEAELTALREWMDNHEHLQVLWPFAEIYSLIISVLQDRRIDEAEHRMLLDFFRSFAAVLDDRTIDRPVAAVEGTLVGVCATCPEVRIAGSKFCFTGTSTRFARDELKRLVEDLGGKVVNTVNKTVDYLVICADGNPNWAYACYGRKVELAVELRRQGGTIILVHENDFHDALRDLD